MSITLQELFESVYDNSVEKGYNLGFDAGKPFDANQESEVRRKLYLIAQEASVEAIQLLDEKTYDEPDDKCPQYSKLAIELTDVLLRTMDLIQTLYGDNAVPALLAKHQVNQKRPFLNGKARNEV